MAEISTFDEIGLSLSRIETTLELMDCHVNYQFESANSQPTMVGAIDVAKQECATLSNHLNKLGKGMKS